jgi:capsule polysaccharide export protein KpsE/RkpR
VARATLVPQDTSSSAGTNTMLTLLGGQSQNFASLLGGGRVSNDLYLIIGRSDNVATDVINRLNLVGPSRRYATVDRAKVKLAKKVDIHLLLGGVMEIETRTNDAKYSKELTAAYVAAISKQLASFGRQLITNKQRIVEQKFRDATARVATAETALNNFRRRNNLAEPDAELGQALALRTQLEAQLQAKLVELQMTQQVRGPESAELQALRSEVGTLRSQLARTARPTVTVGGPNVAGLGALSTQYLNLYRDYRFAQALYDVYARSSEQVAVEQLASESASYVQLIDAAHLDAERKLNTWAIAALAALALLVLFTEWYAPVTGLWGRRRSTAPEKDGAA